MTITQTVLQILLADGESFDAIYVAARKNRVKLHPKAGLRQSIYGSGGAQLETVKINGRRVTTASAYRRFLEAQQRQNRTAVQPAAVLATDDTDRALSAYGLGRDSANGASA